MMDEPPRFAPQDLSRRLVERSYPSDVVANKVRAIYHAVLTRSPCITRGNFESVSPADLELLFELYDEQFYAGDLGGLLRASGAPLRLVLSARLTRSAGLTKRFATRPRRGGPPPAVSRYEIVLSTTLLFQTFRDVERTVRVNGLVCNDRLEASQRVFEHELTHLLEMLVWGASNCDQGRFRALVRNYFGHPQTRHDLVTQQERARARFDVRVGDRVAFEFDGARHEGVVNRITRRATVLVEGPAGEVYSDGKRYVKYYIPLPMLEKVVLPG
ncbi:MAG: hypothetical protein U0797_24270 [Gemmataceae bacterium]